MSLKNLKTYWLRLEKVFIINSSVDVRFLHEFLKMPLFSGYSPLDLRLYSKIKISVGRSKYLNSNIFKISSRYGEK